MDAAIHEELENKKYGDILADEHASIKLQKNGTHVTHLKSAKLPALLNVLLPKGSKIMLITSKDEDVQIAFTLRGYLVDKDLPPITQKSQLGNKPIWKSQQVTITGLGCKEFDNALNVFATLYHLFHQKMGAANIHPMRSRSVNGHPCFHFSKRYFSSTSDGTSKAFSESVDPLGLLTDFGQGLHHNLQNQVGYFRRKNGVQEENSPENVDPAVFQVGHLVDVEFTICSRRCQSDGKWRVFHELETLTLLDNTIDQFIIKRSVHLILTPAYVPKRLIKKRGISYTSSDEEELEVGSARKKMKNLHIDGGNTSLVLGPDAKVTPSASLPDTDTTEYPKRPRVREVESSTSGDSCRVGNGDVMDVGF